MKNNNVGAGLDQPAEKNKGITLIALIITIIVMLILVAVSISIALNTGLFDAAGKATQKTNIAKDQEQEVASGKVNIGGKTYNSIDEYLAKEEIPEAQVCDVCGAIGPWVQECYSCGILCDDCSGEEHDVTCYCGECYVYCRR